nr:hypothetical protein [Tanacetum cinerariifolium]
MDNDKVKRGIDEIETINIEVEHRVLKLVAENEQLKQTYKKLYDSIKPARTSFGHYSLKEELRNLKGKAVDENVVTSPTIALKMYEIDVRPIASRLLHNRMVHFEYLRSTEEQAATLRDIVKQGKSRNPLNSSLDYACVTMIVLLRFENEPLTSRFIVKVQLSLLSVGDFVKASWSLVHSDLPTSRFLTTGRLIDGSPCSGIDMVITNLDLEPKVDTMMWDFLDLSRWKELSKEMSSKILSCGDGSRRKIFKPIASLITKGKLK